MGDNTKEKERKYVIEEGVPSTKIIEPLTDVTKKVENESDTALKILLGEES